MLLVYLRLLYEAIYIFKFILKESLKLCAHVNKWWAISDSGHDSINPYPANVENKMSS
jgi:hypothetical protein